MLAQAESLLYCLEQASNDIGLYVNSDKTVFMCFKQNGVISTLTDKPLKLVDQFTYLSSNISSTESGVYKCIGMAWIAIDSLSIIWKSDHSEEIKWEFFKFVAISVILYRCTTWPLRKCLENKLDGNPTKMVCVLKKPWKKPSTKQQQYSYLSPILKKPSKICLALLEKQTKFSFGLLLMDTSILADQ